MRQGAFISGIGVKSKPCRPHGTDLKDAMQLNLKVLQKIIFTSIALLVRIVHLLQ